MFKIVMFIIVLIGGAAILGGSWGYACGYIFPSNISGIIAFFGGVLLGFGWGVLTIRWFKIL